MTSRREHDVLLFMTDLIERERPAGVVIHPQGAAHRMYYTTARPALDPSSPDYRHRRDHCQPTAHHRPNRIADRHAIPRRDMARVVAPDILRLLINRTDRSANSQPDLSASPLCSFSWPRSSDVA